MIRRTIALIAIGAVLASPGAYALGSPYLQGGAGKHADPTTPGVSREKIVAELNADLEKARQRLSADDAGAQTQSTQQRILDNIDRLLKQQDPNAGGASPNPPPKPSGGQNPSPRPAAGNPNQAPKPTEATTPQPQQAKNSQPTSAKPKPDLAKGTGQPRTLHDMQKPLESGERWPGLPPRHRQGMDAFGRERFIPQYEEMLRAYYRSLGESNRRE